MWYSLSKTQRALKMVRKNVYHALASRIEQHILKQTTAQEIHVLFVIITSTKLINILKTSINQVDS